MTRTRKNLQYIGAILIFLGLAACANDSGTVLEAPRPNFVILFVDDLGATDLGCTGSDLYLTPNIDRLASEGMLFRQAYAACTVCSPSRAALMTGKYPARTRVTDFIPGHSHPNAKLRAPDWTMKLERRHTTIAEALRAAGYRTASVGKWHLMPMESTATERKEDYAPEANGFEVNIGGNEWGLPGSHFFPYRHPTQDRGIGPLPPGGKEGEYLTDRLTDEALKLLDSWGDQPFFLYLPYYAVHIPIQAPASDVERFKPLVKSGARHTDPAYAAMVASVDRSVGRIRAKLTELGTADRTVVLLAGDNGGYDVDGKPTDNAPLRGGKGTAYEGGVRTPTMIYWPDTTVPGSSSVEPIITMDLYSTVLDIAGVSISSSEEIDGVSLVPLLRDPKQSLGRDALYWHYPHYHNYGATPHSAVRAGEWRLVQFYEDSSVELYDLAKDPGETRNLAEQYPAVTQNLKQKLETWLRSVDAQMPTPNPAFVP